MIFVELSGRYKHHSTYYSTLVGIEDETHVIRNCISNSARECATEPAHLAWSQNRLYFVLDHRIVDTDRFEIINRSDQRFRNKNTLVLYRLLLRLSALVIHFIDRRRPLM